MHLRICVVVLLLYSGSVLAWGSKGHRVIAAIAEQQLTPATRAAVAALLDGESLASAATWADTMRSSTDNPEFWSSHAANWHYVNIPAGATYADTPPSPRGDAYAALAAFTAILLDEPVPAGPVREGLEFYFGSLERKPAEVKRFALKFLLHIVGDLQQPLHSGYADDRGGNDVTLQWFGDRSNLHALWDTLLVEQPKLSERRLTARLINRLGRTPAIDIRALERADPLVWIDESRRILQRIYARLDGRNELGAAYAAEFVPTMEQQLVKGGLRTAYLLNGIFGGWPIGTGEIDQKLVGIAAADLAKQQ
jgi:hypothetical protein